MQSPQHLHHRVNAVVVLLAEFSIFYPREFSTDRLQIILILIANRLIITFVERHTLERLR